MRLSVLDFGELQPGQDRGQRLLEVRAEAHLADTMGFERYWLAEHHASNCAWGNPLSLVPLLAQRATRIRVGTGGLLLNIHAAEDVLEFWNGLVRELGTRIDLGLCRGLPPAGESSGTLSVGSRVVTYEQKVEYLLTAIKSSLEKGTGTDARERCAVWLLGSQTTSMQLASRLGCAFGYSLFHTEDRAMDVMERYYSLFQVGHLLLPSAILAVAGFCDDQARTARIQYEHYRSRFIKPSVVGSPRECVEQMQALCTAFKVPEVMFLNLAQGSAARSTALVGMAEYLRRYASQ